MVHPLQEHSKVCMDTGWTQLIQIRIIQSSTVLESNFKRLFFNSLINYCNIMFKMHSTLKCLYNSKQTQVAEGLRTNRFQPGTHTN